MKTKALRVETLLAALVVAVAVTRVLQARESLWLDELHTAWVAGGPLTEVVGRTADGNQSPVFFWLEWLLLHTLGSSELVLRLPSLMAGTMLPILVFRVARNWAASAHLGLLAAWLASVGPQAIYFGTEARPYALIQCLAVLQFAQFARTLDAPTIGRRAALVGGMALLFYLHYTTALLLAAQVVAFGVLRLRGRAVAYRTRDLAIDVAITAVLGIGAVANLGAIYARRGNWHSFVEQRPLWEGLLTVSWAWPAVALAVLSSTVALARRQSGDVQPTQSDNHAHAMTLAACWLLVPILVAWAATATDAARILHPRYVAGAAPAAMILMALGIARIPQRTARLVVAAAIAVYAVASSRIVTELTRSGRLVAYRVDDWRSAVAFFNRQSDHGEVLVVLRSPLVECDALPDTRDPRLRAYCLYPVTSLYRIDVDSQRLIPAPTSAPWGLARLDIERIQAQRTLWMILGGRQANAVILAAQFAQRLSEAPGADRSAEWVVTSRVQFGSTHVVRFER